MGDATGGAAKEAADRGRGARTPSLPGQPRPSGRAAAGTLRSAWCPIQHQEPRRRPTDLPPQRQPGRSGGSSGGDFACGYHVRQLDHCNLLAGEAWLLQQHGCCRPHSAPQLALNLLPGNRRV